MRRFWGGPQKYFRGGILAEEKRGEVGFYGDAHTRVIQMLLGRKRQRCQALLGPPKIWG